MIRTNVRRPIGVAMGAVSVLAVAVSHPRRPDATHAPPFGRCTGPQILRRAGDLLPLLTPDPGHAWFLAEPIPVSERNGTVRHHWLVDCTDEAGEFAGFLEWDSDSGDLLFASGAWFRLPASLAAPLSQREAVASAWARLLALGVARQPTDWRLSCAPERSPHMWHVSWQARDRKAVVGIDDRSGCLLTFRACRIGKPHKPGV